MISVVGILAFTGSVVAYARPVFEVRTALPAGTYLVLLQNNAELRPSGGFIGTIATLELTNYGGVRDMHVDTNIYKRDEAFVASQQVTPPGPLATVTDRWALRDSNWAADFRDAAEQVLWFYDQEGGVSVDGIIAVNASAVQDFLHVTGPVQLPSDGSTITDDTFFDLLHYKVEKEYFYSDQNQRDNEPKTVLRELLTPLLRQAMSPVVLPKLASFLEQQLKEKHVLFYHRDPVVEQRIIERGWAGALPDPGENVLAIVNANIGGQKSSLNMAQDIALTITRNQTGLAHTLHVQRTHRGDGKWPDGENVNYFRALLPSRAQVLRVSNDFGEQKLAEVVNEEAGRTVVGMWLSTAPGQVSNVEIEYVLPDTMSVFTYVKQPGVLADQFRLQAYGQAVYDGLVTSDTSFTID